MKISGGDDDESVGVCNGEESGDSVIVSGGAVAISSAIRGQSQDEPARAQHVRSAVIGEKMSRNPTA